MPFKHKDKNATFYTIDEDGNKQELCKGCIDDLNLSDHSDNISTDTVLKFQESLSDYIDRRIQVASISFDGPIGRKTRNTLLRSLNIALNDTNNYRKFHHKSMKRNRKFKCKVYKYIGVTMINGEEKQVFAEEDRLNHIKIITFDGTKRVSDIVWPL